MNVQHPFLTFKAQIAACLNVFGKNFDVHPHLLERMLVQASALGKDQPIGQRFQLFTEILTEFMVPPGCNKTTADQQGAFETPEGLNMLSGEPDFTEYLASFAGDGLGDEQEPVNVETAWADLSGKYAAVLYLLACVNGIDSVHVMKCVLTEGVLYWVEYGRIGSTKRIHALSEVAGKYGQKYLCHTLSAGDLSEHTKVLP